MRVVRDEQHPLIRSRRTLTIALLDDEQLGAFRGDTMEVPGVGRVHVEEIRTTNAPMPRLERGERVLIVEATVLDGR